VRTPHYKKGASLELQAAAYFQAHGFLVRRNVKLSLAAGTAEATDIDVLAMRFCLPLAEERLIADCRKRKRPRPFERILWTLGLASFSHADRAVVVTPRAPWHARAFASEGGVEVLAVEELNAFLESIRTSFHPFGEADLAIAKHFDRAKKNTQREDKKLVQADMRLRQMLVIGHPLTNLNGIIKTLSSIAETPKQTATPASWLRRYVCFNAAVVASVMLVRFAAESKWSPENQWSDHARKKLTYGDVPPQKAQQLAKLALTRDFYEGLPRPAYTEEVVQAIKSMISRPRVAALAPYALDFQLFGRVLGSLSNDYVSPVLGELQEDTLKMGKRILSALAYAAEIPTSLWDAEKNGEIGRGGRSLQETLPIFDKEKAEDG